VAGLTRQAAGPTRFSAARARAPVAAVQIAVVALLLAYPKTIAADGSARPAHLQALPALLLVTGSVATIVLFLIAVVAFLVHCQQSVAAALHHEHHANGRAWPVAHVPVLDLAIHATRMAHKARVALLADLNAPIAAHRKEQARARPGANVPKLGLTGCAAS
jgi:hypothetical protein